MAGHKPKLQLEQRLPKHVTAGCVAKLCAATLHSTQILSLHSTMACHVSIPTITLLLWSGQHRMLCGEMRGVEHCVINVCAPHMRIQNACTTKACNTWHIYALLGLILSCKLARILVLSSAGSANKPRGGESPALCRRPASILSASPSFRCVQSCCIFVKADMAS